MLQVYEVEKPFPHTKYNVGVEGPCIRFRESGFDVLLIMDDIDSKDLALFNTDNFRYGLFTAQFIPFLVIDLDSILSFECNFNILNLTPPEADQWLRADSNVITFYLIEQKGFILKDMRTITLSEELTILVKETLRKQIETYERKEQVDLQISQITRHYPIEEMLKSI